MYVLEVPSGGATNPEKHIYDEFFLVIEGRGTHRGVAQATARSRSSSGRPARCS